MVYGDVERITFPLPLTVMFLLGSVSFVGYYLIGSWLNTHRLKKVLQTLALFWLASLMEAPVFFYSILSRPRTFEVIRKE
jgi:hypothetical protein